MRALWTIPLLAVTTLAAARQSDEPLEPLTAERIVRLPVALQFDLAPDGKRAAVTVSLTGNSGILVITDPDEQSVPVASGEGSYRDPSWSPDGTRVAFASDRAGGWQIFVNEPGGENPRQVTTGNDEQRRPRWSPDGQRIAFLSRQRTGSSGWDVSVIAAEGGDARRLTHDPLDEDDPRWSPDGRWIAFSSRGGHYVNRRIVVVPADGGESRELLPSTWDGDSHSPRWSPDGKQVAFVSDRDGRNAVFVVSAEGGDPRRLTGGQNEQNEQTDPAWSPDGTEIAYVENEEGTMRLMAISLGDGRSRSFTLARGVYQTPQWSPDGTTLAALFSGSVYSPDVWLYEKTGGRTRLSNSLPLAIDVRQLARAELVHYPSRDGRTISGYLYAPPAASADQPAPLILHAHAEPQWTNGWHPFVQLLAQQGFAVFVPNPRGSSGFGRDFEALNDGDWGGGELEDLVAGVEAITARPEIRDGGIGIWGVGHGAFLAITALGKHPDLFACGVEAMGTPDLELLYRETNTEGVAYLEHELGPLRGHVDRYRELSPIRYGDAMKAPLLSFHSEVYPPAPYAIKLGWLEALHSRDYPVEEFVFKEDQGEAVFQLDRYPNAALFYMQEVLDFFRAYLMTTSEIRPD